MQKNHHKWLLDVLHDIAAYAKLNSLDRGAEAIISACDVFEEEQKNSEKNRQSQVRANGISGLFSND